MVTDEENELDPQHHPDLRRLGRELRRQMEDTLDAELHAARAAARRRRTVRDVLLAAEDRREVVLVTTLDGERYRGTVIAVGADHIELHDGEIRRVVAADTIAVVTLP